MAYGNHREGTSQTATRRCVYGVTGCLQAVRNLITSHPSRVLWALLIVYVALGVGIWGISHAVGAHQKVAKAWYGCLLTGIAVLAVANVALVYAVVSSRRRHQELLEALLPREIVKSLKDEGSRSFGKARIMKADTPADLLLSMMGELLVGRLPDIGDVLFIRTVLMRNMDVYQPLNLNYHIKGANLD
ncbi:hypothetical protein Agub_g3585, partial [Astrephomene gubernaculifera]